MFCAKVKQLDLIYAADLDGEIFRAIAERSRKTRAGSRRAGRHQDEGLDLCCMAINNFFFTSDCPGRLLNERVRLC